jgi:hypothetical protein
VSIAFVGLQVGKPAQGCDGMSLVREPEGHLVPAETVIAIEQSDKAKATDASPKVVGCMPGLFCTYRGCPASVMRTRTLFAGQGRALAADGGLHGGGDMSLQWRLLAEPLY